MKEISWIRLALFATVVLTIGVVAQTTNVTTIPISAPLGGGNEWWRIAIAALSPVVVWGMRRIAPKVPTLLLPMSAPLIGLGLGALLKSSGTADLSWFDAGQAGAVGVFVREVVNQGVTKPMAAVAKAKKE